MTTSEIVRFLLLCWAIFPAPLGAADRTDVLETAASSTADGSSPAGAVEGDRFATEATKCWRGKAGESSWWWEARFPEARSVGAILQVVGDHDLVLRNAPKKYVWQASADGRAWKDLPGTTVDDERRTFRLHRLKEVHEVRALRLLVREAGEGKFPTLREAEFFADPGVDPCFAPWSVVVSTTGEKKVPGAGTDFVTLSRKCVGWDNLKAQNVWLGDFNEAFVAAEPRPLCAFLSGNFIDWCQQEREHWRGAQEVLRAGRLPMWAACGGAQGLAILADTGVDKPWDCPHCRDPQAPKTPIYGHIGHTAKKPCGDYTGCIFERGASNVLQTADDPVFAGLPREFRTIESHCGQIEYVPKGWVLIAAGGKGALTKTQCIRLKDGYVYAAQFHIEMDGTPDSSRAIMGNFLKLAKEWGGYNPDGEPVPEPKPYADTSP